ncbi:MAG: nitrilase-related carbon-nitrogen hydrolase, partial [Sphingomonadales bacterium]
MSRSLKIALAQINTIVGDFSGNREKVVENLSRAAERGADLVVFPELVVTSYPPEDLMLKPAFLAEAYETLDQIAATTKPGGPAALVGCPTMVDDELFNALFLIGDGKVLHRQLKKHLPNYGVFDEKRVFSEGPMPEPVEF